MDGFSQRDSVTNLGRLFYAVLVDLGDTVADQLCLPIDAISLEMIYRGLYHFYVAHQQGKATDPILYFT